MPDVSRNVIGCITYLNCSFCDPDNGASYICAYRIYIHSICKYNRALYMYTNVSMYMHPPTGSHCTHIVHGVAMGLVSRPHNGLIFNGQCPKSIAVKRLVRSLVKPELSQLQALACNSEQHKNSKTKFLYMCKIKSKHTHTTV